MILPFMLHPPIKEQFHQFILQQWLLVFLQESVNSSKDDFKEFVDTLIVALREMERDKETAVVPIRLVEAVPVPTERL